MDSYELQKLVDLENRRLALQRAAEERARLERIALFNRTNKNTNPAYDDNSEDKKVLAKLRKPTPQSNIGKIAGAFLGGVGGVGLGTAIPAMLKSSIAITPRKVPVAGVTTAVASGLGTGLLTSKLGELIDKSVYNSIEAKRLRDLPIYEKKVKDSKLDKIDPSVYYVLEYNDDAYNRGIHKVLYGFDDKTHALAYRNEIRKQGKQAFINKGSTLLAKGADISGI